MRPFAGRRRKDLDVAQATFPRQLLNVVRRIAMEVPLSGIDVVEVAPPCDHAEVTGFLASRVVLEALSGPRGGGGGWRAIRPGPPGGRSHRYRMGVRHR
jgi:hypothetical protein